MGWRKSVPTAVQPYHLHKRSTDLKRRFVGGYPTHFRTLVENGGEEWQTNAGVVIQHQHGFDVQFCGREYVQKESGRGLGKEGRGIRCSPVPHVFWHLVHSPLHQIHSEWTVTDRIHQTFYQEHHSAIVEAGLIGERFVHFVIHLSRNHCHGQPPFVLVVVTQMVRHFGARPGLMGGYVLAHEILFPC